jgi:hypothetical protein
MGKTETIPGLYTSAKRRRGSGRAPAVAGLPFMAGGAPRCKWEQEKGRNDKEVKGIRSWRFIAFN